MVWYVIGGNTKKLEKFDQEVIRTIYSLGIPVIVALTQVDILKDDELKALKVVIEEYVRKLTESIIIIEVAASPKDKADQKGLDQLVKKSIELIPSLYKDAFIYAQKINIKSKRRVAWIFIGSMAITCLGSALVPVPGTTPATLLFTRSKLLETLGEIYNSQKYLKPLAQVAGQQFETTGSLVATAVVDLAAVALGLIVPALFLPTTTLAGAIAATYVIIIGIAYVVTLEGLAEKFFDSNTTQEEIQSYIAELFKENFKRYSRIRVGNRQDIDRIGQDFIDE